MNIIELAKFKKMAGGGGSGDGIITVQTATEMDNIITNATAADVGKAYIFAGESNDTYKNNAIYIIREV